MATGMTGDMTHDELRAEVVLDPSVLDKGIVERWHIQRDPQGGYRVVGYRSDDTPRYAGSSHDLTHLMSMRDALNSMQDMVDENLRLKEKIGLLDAAMKELLNDVRWLALNHPRVMNALMAVKKEER